MIHLLGYTCWVVNYPPCAGGDDGGVPHYTRDQAIESRREIAADYPGEPVSIHELPGPCCCVTCADCEIEPEEDDCGTLHFESEGECLAYLQGARWRINPAGELLCPECAKDLPAVADSPEHLQEAMQPLYVHARCGGTILFTIWGALCADCGVVGIPDDEAEPQGQRAGGER